jgi:hypothetical protein
MLDRNLARGLFLAAVALAFGIGALHYPIGKFSHAGAGLFPLMISSLLLLIGVSMIIRSRFEPNKPLVFNFKNIGLLLLSLTVFALSSKFLNMSVGIAGMVFLSAFAGKSSYSVARNLKVTAALLVLAFAFHKLFGLNLNLY